ncbi:MULTISPECIES: tetratricopeptide repeat protein [Ramlibacter]|uniref:Tetratricopeptide repeat protein n=1 Tax=Ramlibacter aquaticus TaxID=2780094 RepID=A0ABR9SFM5_9BURK|nr:MULTISPECIES: tetratricopeptide repeat protein [Ramlibacter]MBE7941151.1 tetratricopeptide repeat protein [Ramlibacter aquaticus]
MVVAKAATPADTPAARPDDKPAPKLAEKAPGKTVDKGLEKVAASKASEKPVEKSSDKPVPQEASAKPAAESATRVAKVDAKARPEPKAVVMAPGIVKSATNAPGVEVAAATPTADGRLERSVGPQQQSDNLYKQALLMLQQGNGIEARPLLRRALQANPANGAARQALANLLIESNSLGEATALLREGTQQSPERPSLWTTLARLQVEQGDSAGALATLEQGASHAGDDAGFNALYAVMLQRTGRHDEAVKRFLTALRSDPAMPNWLVGIGISLQALGRDGDALQAFQRAREGGRLPASLVAFVDARLEQLKPH